MVGFGLAIPFSLLGFMAAVIGAWCPIAHLNRILLLRLSLCHSLTEKRQYIRNDGVLL